MEPQRKVSLSIALDLGMIGALASLCFWVGAQANRIENLTQNITTIQGQLATIAANDSRAEIAALKQRSLNEDEKIADLKDTLLRRLDKIETKLDTKPGR